jgi:hypothetical protein
MPDKSTVDPVNNEILVPSWPNTVLIFDRLATGNVAPKRILYPPFPRSLNPYQETTGPAHVYENNLVIKQSDQILIYERTASGNARPKGVIRGAKSRVSGGGYNSTAISPKGWIVSACTSPRSADGAMGGGSAVCAWHVTDNGEVPPRWTIPVERATGGYVFQGVALNPAHKEVIINLNGRIPDYRQEKGAPDSKLEPKNAVATFSWPEIF